MLSLGVGPRIEPSGLTVTEVSIHFAFISLITDVDDYPFTKMMPVEKGKKNTSKGR
ncbi:hypothetical protein GCM10007906_18460 [Vibrio hyugaensis]|jgi:hypothetical protein|uniref:Uncharacterized protein n=1 Tax=Vibrio hyugaensis TaxID=1534743 RepID=A0ABQ5Y0M7_9VIBR|nr:hypothetical protein GCM10007906_18460 [Vibrio hyugaensis]